MEFESVQGSGDSKLVNGLWVMTVAMGMVALLLLSLSLSLSVRCSLHRHLQWNSGAGKFVNWTRVVDCDGGWGWG